MASVCGTQYAQTQKINLRGYERSFTYYISRRVLSISWQRSQYIKKLCCQILWFICGL